MRALSSYEAPMVIGADSRGRQVVFGAGVAVLALVGFLSVRSAFPSGTTPAPAGSESEAAPDDSIEELLPPPLPPLGASNDAAVEMTFDVDAATPRGRRQ